MSARDLILANKKPGDKYTVIESIIMAWYVKHPVDADEAAAELAALVARLEQAEAERDVYRKGYEAAQKYAESLPRDVRAGFFIGGHDVIVSLIEYNKVTVDTLKMAFARVLSGKAAE